MPNLVVDSSVIIKWLNRQNEAYLEQADKILADAQSGKTVLFAPQLSRYEAGNALLNKKLELPLAFDSLGTSYSLPVNFISETAELAFETYKMAREAGVTYYDATFTALAKQEKAVLVTDNPKHQKKVKGVKVIPLKDYS